MEAGGADEPAPGASSASQAGESVTPASARPTASSRVAMLRARWASTGPDHAERDGRLQPERRLVLVAERARGARRAGRPGRRRRARWRRGRGRGRRPPARSRPPRPASHCRSSSRRLRSAQQRQRRGDRHALQQGDALLGSEPRRRVPDASSGPASRADPSTSSSRPTPARWPQAWASGMISPAAPDPERGTAGTRSALEQGRPATTQSSGETPASPDRKVRSRTATTARASVARQPGRPAHGAPDQQPTGLLRLVGGVEADAGQGAHAGRHAVDRVVAEQRVQHLAAPPAERGHQVRRQPRGGAARRTPAARAGPRSSGVATGRDATVTGSAAWCRGRPARPARGSGGRRRRRGSTGRGARTGSARRRSPGRAAAR